MLNLYKHSMLRILRDKSTVFWIFMFPVILSTLYNMTFGGAIKNEDASFVAAGVAVVEEVSSDYSSNFIKNIKNCTYEDDSSMFNVTEAADYDEAIELLNNGDVSGVVVLNDEIEFVVNSSGTKERLIKNFIDIFDRNYEMIAGVMAENPENMEVFTESLGESGFVRETSVSGKNINVLMQYFYALIAFTCIGACDLGLMLVYQMQGNLTATGMRRCLSPMKKSKQIITDIGAGFTIHMILIVLVIMYIIFGLGIPMRDHIGMVIVVSAVGSLFGMALGVFIGAMVKTQYSLKSSVLVAVRLMLGALSGMMYAELKGMVDMVCPIINKLNPAALVTDSFYCLSVYDDYTRIIRNITVLLIMSVTLAVVSVIQLRRSRYAGIEFVSENI